MEQQGNDPTPVWHEQSAIWEIIAGELVVQHGEWTAANHRELVARAGERAELALRSQRAGDADAAGHALIGCSLAAAIAARQEGDTATPLPEYGAELAAAVSWQAAPPTESDLETLGSEIATRLGGDRAAPTLWELAVRAGGFAAGLSPQISRRRERRDLVSTVA